MIAVERGQGERRAHSAERFDELSCAQSDAIATARDRYQSTRRAPS
jgi:hypothetical protein